MAVHEFMVMHERMTLAEYRRAYPVVQLTAILLNALGGKSDSGESLSPSKRFEVEELMPAWALPEALIRDLPFTLRQCAVISEAIGQRAIPSWALQVIDLILPVDKIQRLAGQGKGPDLGGWEALRAQ
jgi:hypothetical protein